VRGAGKQNAESLPKARSWKTVRGRFYEVFRDALSSIGERMTFDYMKNESNARSGRVEKIVSAEDIETSELQKLLGEHYKAHFEKVNVKGTTERGYVAAKRTYDNEILELIPNNTGCKVLDIGCGYGHMMRYLLERGFNNVIGIDKCEPLINAAKEHVSGKGATLVVADASEFLSTIRDEFGCVLLIDVLEHFSTERALELLVSVRSSLIQGGRIVIRTPNMGNVLGCYSMYIDATHMAGYTDWSLLQLLEIAGFVSSTIHVPSRYENMKKRCYGLMNTLLHRVLYRIQGRSMPLSFGKNIVAWGEKGHSSMYSN
jgi:2-polyprenyl-3-methyl-5-hydroxy-6-metoxy-1,4-benzoquinol methylase